MDAHCSHKPAPSRRAPAAWSRGHRGSLSWSPPRVGAGTCGGGCSPTGARVAGGVQGAAWGAARPSKGRGRSDRDAGPSPRAHRRALLRGPAARPCARRGRLCPGGPATLRSRQRFLPRQKTRRLPPIAGAVSMLNLGLRHLATNRRQSDLCFLQFRTKPALCRAVDVPGNAIRAAVVRSR